MPGMFDMHTHNTKFRGPLYIAGGLTSVRDLANNKQLVELHMPAIRHHLVLLLGDQIFAELKGSDGKKKLKEESLKVVQDAMKEAAGSVVVRDLFMTETAELADYVASGFGQTNFPADTQFSVATLEDTVIFTTWSQRRSDDPERAEAAFEAIASVGTPLEISK